MDVALLDYGTGNLHSLAKALQATGASVRIEADPALAARSQAVVLPGVGSFGAAAARLASGSAALRQALAGGTPCLAVCLGMQLLFEASEEGEGAGIGLLEGRVRRLHTKRVPHMGWNDVVPAGDDPLLEQGPFTAYYANGYAVEPADPEQVIAWTRYDGFQFPAAVRRHNTWGVQFHPEKSGAAGLRLIADFLAEARRA
jgi:glutamine amidotransferase